MNQDQVLSIVRSLLKVAAGFLLAHNMSRAAGIVSGEDFVAVVLGIISFVWSNFVHTDKPNTPPANGKTACWIAALVLPFFLVQGCATGVQQGGAYAPVLTNSDGSITQLSAADLPFYVVDSSFQAAYSVVDAAFNIERNNRTFLWGVNPKIKHTLDSIRPAAWQVVKDYTAARAAYIANPTPAGLSTLQTLLSKVQALAAAAQAVMTVQVTSSVGTNTVTIVPSATAK